MAVLLIGLFSLPALAQYTKDAAANKKIDEAINQHYLMMELDKAEGVLTGTVGACGDKCSPGTLAKAWMYVGIVRGSGKNDQAGAGEAFAKAKAIDPGVKLDAALATPETKATFESTPGGSASDSEPIATAPIDGGDEAIPGDMLCTPETREVETRRPIPISCVTEEEVATVTLKFKEFGSDDWKKIEMNQVGEFWQAEIPCDMTRISGTLSWFVVAEDDTGDQVDGLGSKNAPVQMSLADTVASEPPAYPGQAAPERCAGTADCPPDFPGCGDSGPVCGDKDWGESCDNSAECKCGLLCNAGACETAPSCDVDSDCDTGTCVDGYCSVTQDDAESGPTGPYKTHWFGVSVGYDLPLFGGADPCYAGTSPGFADNVQENENFRCFEAGTDVAYPNGFASDQITEEPAPSDGIQTGIAPGAIRVMLTYEYALSRSMTLGGRLGYAFGGAPADFMPVHAEARGTYYFGGLSKGLSPYLGASAGVAQVDGKVTANFITCSGDARNECSATPDEIDVYKQMGIVFVSGNAGLAWLFTDNMGLKANLNAMFLLPKTGFALMPSLGFMYGL